jgi:hypothetical protein
VQKINFYPGQNKHILGTEDEFLAQMRVETPSQNKVIFCINDTACGAQWQPLLVWAGGTYARREADFPEEQSTATWLKTHMLPLDIKAPGFDMCRSLEQVLKTWERAEWYGKAPHRLALTKPFPYATASMQEFFSNRRSRQVGTNL